MFTDEQYYSAMDSQESEHIEFDCEVLKHSGILVELEGTLAIVDEEFNYVTRLPSFITSFKSARCYLSNLQHAYKDGEERGANRFKSDLARLLGVVTVDTRNNDVERIESRLDRMEA